VNVLYAKYSHLLVMVVHTRARHQVAPFDGTVQQVVREQDYGWQLWLVPTAAPSLIVRIFHVEPVAVSNGSRITVGDSLGMHASYDTDADVAVMSMGSGNDWAYLSYMDLLLPAALDA
jgi:hypothetical protein